MMSYRDHLPPRVGAEGMPVFPLTFPDSLDKPAQRIAARSGETRSGSTEGKSLVPERHAPNRLFSFLYRLIGTPNAR